MKFLSLMLAAAFAFFSCAPYASAASPERAAVVGVLPLPSVLCLYLGSAEKIIAMPPASMSAARGGLLGELFPDLLKAKTSFASGAGVNIEELLSMRPDVVFYLDSDKITGRALENAGLRAVAVSPSRNGYNVMRTYEDWLLLLAGIFPERAGACGAALEYGARIEALVAERTRALAPEKRRRALFIVRAEGGRIVTSGKNFFGQYWCDAAGARNAAEEITAERSNAVVTMEQIYKWNPDAIFITNFTELMPEDILAGGEWAPVEAVRRGAVHKMPLALYRAYTPGPDAPLTLLWLARTLYPELFDDIDMAKEAVKYYKDIFGLEVSEERARRIYGAEGGPRR